MRQSGRELGHTAAGGGLVVFPPVPGPLWLWGSILETGQKVTFKVLPGGARTLCVHTHARTRTHTLGWESGNLTSVHILVLETDHWVYFLSFLRK